AEISRRGLLGGMAVLGAVSATGCAPRPVPLDPRPLPAGAFPWGVMSGDPQPNSLSLWTKVRTTGAGLFAAPVQVAWQVAADEGFREIAAAGTVSTDASRDHSVKVTARGLDPDRRWFYRFMVDGASSSHGQTRTAPAADSSPERLRIAFLSCQMYSEGYFSAYRHLLDDDVDLVLHLGDYIYEYGTASKEFGLKRLRQDLVDSPKTVEGFRSKYGLYRTDPDLVECHRQLPFVAMWDDHEVYDDYNRDVDPTVRDAAYQAWFENMPFQASADDPHRIHRSLRWGDLVDMYLMDLAQYREPEAPAPFLSTSKEGAVAHKSGRTLLGERQLADVKDWLSTSDAAWRLFGNPQMLKQLRLVDLDTPLLRRLDPNLARNAGLYLNGTQWDGYQWERQQLLDHMAATNISDNIVLTGDVHSWFAGTVPQDVDNPKSPIVAAEFVGSSVTSPGFDYYTSSSLPFLNAPIKQALGSFDYVNLFDHGYGICEITRESTTVDFRRVDIDDPGAGVESLAKFKVERGDHTILRNT
ncbi:MAG TPA: alkaline phosphatase D family protein, partial [Microthrixaceae bacterium]|nr:alkaline phosphatase D family protein [Microthrixaceae bacterium]